MNRQDFVFTLLHIYRLESYRLVDCFIGKPVYVRNQWFNCCVELKCIPVFQDFEMNFRLRSTFSFFLFSFFFLFFFFFFCLFVCLLLFFAFFGFFFRFFFIFTFYNSNVPMGFCPGKIGFLSPGKASCDKVALPNLRCMLGVLVFP